MTWHFLCPAATQDALALPSTTLPELDPIQVFLRLKPLPADVSLSSRFSCDFFAVPKILMFAKGNPRRP